MKKSAKRVLIGVIILVFLILVFHFATTKTFRGRVVDADTKEPIEGAVVVAEWMTEHDTPTATHTDLKDVKECLTDKKGTWSIRGPRGWAKEPISYSSLFIPYTKEPEFIVFKPGYCSWPNGFYIDACRNRIKITGDKDEGIGDGGTLGLPKLTNREDRLRALPEPVSGKGSRDKQDEFIRLINEERRSLGLQGTYKIRSE